MKKTAAHWSHSDNAARLGCSPRIETLDDLKHWIKASNQPLTDEELCTLQDCYGHSNFQTIKRIVIEACETPGDDYGRGRVLFAINKIMGTDATFNFLDLYIRHRTQAVIDQNALELFQQHEARQLALEKRGQDQIKAAMDRTAVIMAREMSLANSRRKINRRLGALNDTIKKQERMIDDLRADRNHYRDRARAAEQQTKDARRLTAALRTLKTHLADL